MTGFPLHMFPDSASVSTGVLFPGEIGRYEYHCKCQREAESPLTSNTTSINFPYPFITVCRAGVLFSPIQRPFGMEETPSHWDG